MPFNTLVEAAKSRKSNKIMLAVTIASLLVTTTALIYAIYTRRASKVAREPVFMLDFARTRILTAKDLEVAPIKVLKKRDNTEIKSDLTAIRCYFWNKGKKPIKRGDILSGLGIMLDDPTSEIIDFKVLKVSREVTGFKLIPDPSNDEVLAIDFRILEHNDGATCQIIYEGDPDSHLKLFGTIEGVESILTPPPRPLIKRVLPRPIPLTVSVLLFGTIAFLFGVLALRTYRYTKSVWDEEAKGESTRLKKLLRGIGIPIFCSVAAMAAFNTILLATLIPILSVGTSVPLDILPDTIMP